MDKEKKEQYRRCLKCGVITFIYITKCSFCKGKKELPSKIKFGN